MSPSNFFDLQPTAPAPRQFLWNRRKSGVSTPAAATPLAPTSSTARRSDQGKDFLQRLREAGL